MQTVDLAEAKVERRGIPTASVTLLARVTAAIRPPRALAVPFPLGCLLGEARDSDIQTEVLRQLLALLTRIGVPVLEGLRLQPGISGSRQRQQADVWARLQDVSWMCRAAARS